MNVKQMKRNISKAEYEARQIVATPYGSLIKTFCILNGIDITPAEFIKMFKKVKKGLPFMGDKDFIQKTLECFGYNYNDIEGKPVCLCEDSYNSIFCPFIVGEDEVVLLPLFKDRSYLRIQEQAMANDAFKIIDWEANDPDEDA